VTEAAGADAARHTVTQRISRLSSFRTRGLRGIHRPRNSSQVRRSVSVDLSTATASPVRQNGSPAAPGKPAEGTVRFFSIDRELCGIWSDEVDQAAW
jgi:hypothetical protein